MPAPTTAARPLSCTLYGRRWKIRESAAPPRGLDLRVAMICVDYPQQTIHVWRYAPAAELARGMLSALRQIRGQERTLRDAATAARRAAERN
jgi:hypothetical protein